MVRDIHPSVKPQTETVKLFLQVKFLFLFHDFWNPLISLTC